MAAKADLTSVLMELQGNWTRRWEAIGLLKYLFSCANLPWKLKRDGISFLVWIMDGIVSHTDTDSDSPNDSSNMSTMYTNLKVGYCMSISFLQLF